MPAVVSSGDANTRSGPQPYVAIVDDDSGFSQYLRTFLRVRGYETRCYARGDDLLASLAHAELPDAVVLDVMMPGLDGLATLRALKASRPDAQVIMLSGRNQTSTIVEAVRLGAADYVIKPDDPEGLGEIALDVAIKNALERTRLVSELSVLRQQLTDDEDRAVWGTSEKMRSIATVIEQVADSDVTALVRGESGVGKELIARAIHQRSARRDQPFVKVNCAALPADLLESELFGHERGAFTGAAATRIGKFEQANAGTLLLDEIGEMKPALQAKLLHVLQDEEFTRLGSNKPIQIDVRIIAATNRDLEKMLTTGDFREDLYYRLNVIGLTVPPLRERVDEIPSLIQSFVSRYSRKYNRPLHRISDGLRDLFLRYHWPGNIRELENMIKRVVVLQDEELVAGEIRGAMERSTATPPAVEPAPPPTPTAAPVNGEPIGLQAEPDIVEDQGPPQHNGNGGTLAEIARAAAMKAERAAIERTLNDVQWNRRKAAVLLGVSYKTLLNKIKDCGITRT